jgi:membrane associated rhomboid family serine protease
MSLPNDGMALPERIEPQFEPEDAFIGPLFEGKQAREWALVLQSQSIAYIMRHVGDGWIIQVSPAEYERALEAISLYEQENEDWPPQPVRDTPRHAPSPVVALAFFSLAIFFAYFTGPAGKGSTWFVRGTADAQLMLHEPWRAITALTLHSDAKHVLGNALSGTIFGSMLARRLGPGGALLAIVIGGALGNFANALYYLPDPHLSIGASTAVFAAVAMLAAVQTVLGWSSRHERRFGWMDLVAPVIGGLALLGSLGSGRGNTDLTAHAFGFAAGLLVGLVAALVVRGRDTQPSKRIQLACAVASFGLVGGAWLIARL